MGSNPTHSVLQMKNIVDTLKRDIPGHAFEDRNGTLYVDGRASGPLKVINEDINSYYALDSESEYVKMIRLEIVFWLRRRIVSLQQALERISR